MLHFDILTNASGRSSGFSRMFLLGKFEIGAKHFIGLVVVELQHIY
jgi:hypothetical protein